MSEPNKSYVECPGCQGVLIYEEDIKGKEKHWPGDPIKKESGKWGVKCKHCQGIFTSFKNIFYCEKHQSKKVRTGFKQPCPYSFMRGVGKIYCDKNHTCDKCADEYHQQLKDNLQTDSKERFIDHFKNLDTSNFASGKWKHCNQNFNSKEEFINHIENCSNYSLLIQIVQRQCNRCGKIAYYDKFFVADNWDGNGHNCQSSQNNNNQDQERESIRQYMVRENIRLIRLVNNNLEVEYNNGQRQQPTNNNWWNRIRNYLTNTNQNQIKVEEISPKGTNKNSSQGPPSIWILVIGLGCLGLGVIGFIWKFPQRNYNKRVN